jgi:DNA-binding response OmpR family regulator
MVVKMTLAPKILFISNQQVTLPLGIINLAPQRIQIVMEHRPTKVVQRWSEETPDIIVFDIDGTQGHGPDLIHQLREQAVVPILWMSTNYTEKFILEAYEAGVDEYIVKPTLPSILQAKIKAWLRRSQSVPVDMLDPLKVGQVQFIPSERTIIFQGRDPIRLTNLELRLMYYLISHPDRTVTAEELCQRGWGSPDEANKTALKNVVYRLRQKIEVDPERPQYIRTVAGVGYQFTLD